LILKDFKFLLLLAFFKLHQAHSFFQFYL